MNPHSDIGDYTQAEVYDLFEHPQWDAPGAGEYREQVARVYSLCCEVRI